MINKNTIDSPKKVVKVCILTDLEFISRKDHNFYKEKYNKE